MNAKQKSRRLAAAVSNQARHDDAHAFLPDPSEGGGPVSDDLSERLGEEFVTAATSGEDPDDERLDETVPEEIGGPFIETTADEEMAFDTDESNPSDAKREPFPRVVGANPTPGRDVSGLEDGGDDEDEEGDEDLEVDDARAEAASGASDDAADDDGDDDVDKDSDEEDDEDEEDDDDAVGGGRATAAKRHP